VGFSVYVKKGADHEFFVFEVFTSEDAVKEHYATSHYKQYAKELVDVLAKPPTVQSLPIPSEWFPTDD
jgi:quinol monooxygenase YgiN